MPECHQPTIETKLDKTNFLKTKMLRQIKLTQHSRFKKVFVYSGSTGSWM